MTMDTAEESLRDAWRINNRVSTFLVEGIPSALWGALLPGRSRKTVGSIAAHLHNCRVLWMRSLASSTGIAIPAQVGATSAKAEVVRALERSGAQIGLMLEAGIRNGGQFPGVASAFFYGAMPRDVILFVGYALSHEGHHRGQILIAARALGQRLPREVVDGLWQWSTRLKEARGTTKAGAPKG